MSRLWRLLAERRARDEFDRLILRAIRDAVAALEPPAADVLAPIRADFVPLLGIAPVWRYALDAGP